MKADKVNIHSLIQAYTDTLFGKAHPKAGVSKIPPLKGENRIKFLEANGTGGATSDYALHFTKGYMCG